MYEAGTIHSVLGCRESAQDKTPLWLLYLTQAVQLGMVVNASTNFPIYFCVGQLFRQATLRLLGCEANNQPGQQPKAVTQQVQERQEAEGEQ